ncbi:MAG: VanZ family protein [Bradyrhizobiaceae bacterium]|nr:MAG: VanZ family protein [Bradyrhizobiaceae bacterium]
MKRNLLVLLAWACLAFIAFATLSPIQMRPHLAGAHIEHVAAFAVLSCFFSLLYPRRLLTVLVIIIGIAVGLEVLQNFAHGRHPRLIDVAFKTAGAICGTAAALILQWIYSVVCGKNRSPDRTT